MGQDAASLRRFYGQAFGWDFVGMDNDYAMVNAPEGGIPGGVGPAPDGVGWATFYVEVDNIQAAVDAVVAAGGEVLQAPVEMPDVTIALVADPEGHRFGLAHQPGAAA